MYNKLPLFPLLNWPVSTTRLSWVSQETVLGADLCPGDQVYLKHARTGQRKQGFSGRQVSRNLHLHPRLFRVPRVRQSQETLIEVRGHTED